MSDTVSDTATPRVSIVIAAHDRATYLRAALESALTQNVPGGCEILVVDDNSTDETPSVIAEFARREPSVRGLRVQCGKPSGTRNAGIRAARGEFIAFLDDDDLYLRPWIADALARFDADGDDLAMVYGQAQPVDDALQPVLPPFPPLPLAEGHPVAAFLDVSVHLNTVLIRKTALDEVGVFDEALAGAEDKDLTARIARRFRVAALTGEPLAIVRFHATGRGGKAGSLRARWDDESGVLQRHYAIADEHQPTPSARAGTLRRLRGWYTSVLITQAETDLALDDRVETKKALGFAWGMSPLHAAKDRRFWTLWADVWLKARRP